MEVITLIIAIACVLIEFVTIIRQDKENAELNRENAEQEKTIMELDNALGYTISKVKNRDKLIKKLQEENKDLYNNMEVLYNSLTPQKKKLARGE